MPAPLRRTFITLAQVDGARKDILEAISHGPRGDIVSVYTTFRSLHRRYRRAELAKSLDKECDPSGSRFNLRLAVPVEVGALRAA